MANYSPADDPGLIAYFPGFDQYPQYWWKNAGKTIPATTTGDVVAAVDSGQVSGPTWVKYNVEPTLADDGSAQFGGSGGTECGFAIASSAALLNDIHNLGYAEIGFLFKPDSGFGFRSSPVFDNTNLNATGRGIFAGTQAADTSHAKFRFYLNNGSAQLLNIVCPEWIDDNAWHRVRIHVEPGPGLSWAQVDDGTRMYATLNLSDLVSGNAAQIVVLGTRASLSTPFPGRAKNVRIGTTWLDSRRALWELDSPKGSITGSPELRGSRIHLNASKEYYNCPNRLYFDGYQISEPGDSDGAVYAWNNSSGWQGSGHGAGAPPEGGETVNSTVLTVDGVVTPFAYGGYYTGESLSLTRDADSVAFNQVHTYSILGTTKHDRVRMTRNSTAGSGGTPGVLTMYPLRHSINVWFPAIVGIDADGNIVYDQTISTGAGITGVTGSPVAVAQFSTDARAGGNGSTTGLVRLILCTKGADLPGYRFIVIGQSQNMRIYQELQSYQSNFSESAGTTFEMASTTKFFTATSSNWKDLAATEVQAMLATASGGRKSMGLGLGLSYGSRRF